MRSRSLGRERRTRAVPSLRRLAVVADARSRTAVDGQRLACREGTARPPRVRNVRPGSPLARPRRRSRPLPVRLRPLRASARRSARARAAAALRRLDRRRGGCVARASARRRVRQRLAAAGAGLPVASRTLPRLRSLRRQRGAGSAGRPPAVAGDGRRSTGRRGVRPRGLGQRHRAHARSAVVPARAAACARIRRHARAHLSRRRAPGPRAAVCRSRLLVRAGTSVRCCAHARGSTSSHAAGSPGARRLSDGRRARGRDRCRAGGSSLPSTPAGARITSPRGATSTPPARAHGGPGRCVSGQAKPPGFCAATPRVPGTLVRACTIDGPASGRFGDLPVVGLDAVGSAETVLVGVRPLDQARLADRLRARFTAVVTWYDLLPGGDGGW